MSDAKSEGVRPTRGVLESLRLPVPPLTTILHELDEPLIKKAQSVPDVVRSGKAERILALTDRVWFKVKRARQRGAATCLAKAEARALPVEHHWWLGATGIRHDDSPQDDFYAQLKIDHYDADDIVDEIEQLVETSGGSAAGSGEEYRRRLANALDAEPGLREHLEALPHGIGSGFRSSTVEGNRYVFCMRMGPDDSEHVWFRNVPVDERWAPFAVEPGVMQVEDDTLKSLVTADPGSVTMSRELSDAAFRGAYDAWDLAREHAHTEWMRGTDPANLTPELPKVFREAAEIVLAHGAGLAVGKQGELMKRLKAVPSVKARNAMRRAIRGHKPGPELIPAIETVLVEFGIQPAEKVVPLTPIDKDDVRLVAWMAVQGSTVSGAI